MKRAAFYAIALLFLLTQSRAFGADETILLEQSQIVGGGPRRAREKGSRPSVRPSPLHFLGGLKGKRTI